MVAGPWGLMNMGIDVHAYGGYAKSWTYGGIDARGWVHMGY